MTGNKKETGAPMFYISDPVTFCLFGAAAALVISGLTTNKWMLFIFGLWILTKLEVTEWLSKRN